MGPVQFEKRRGRGGRKTIKKETYELAVSFLETELTRTAAMKSKILVLHPGSHVNAGEEAGTSI